jgi:fructose/tagatose bisphosphate aldolase
MIHSLPTLFVLQEACYLRVGFHVDDLDLRKIANKKYYDPRVWVREGEKTMSARVKAALDDFNTAGQL